MEYKTSNVPDIYSPMIGWREDEVKEQAILFNRPIENIRLLRYQGEHIRRFFYNFINYPPDHSVIKSMFDIIMKNKSDDWKYNHFFTISPYQYIDKSEEKKYYEKERKKSVKRIISTIYFLNKKLENIKHKETRQEILDEIEWYEDELCGMSSDKEKKNIWVKLTRGKNE